MTVDIDVLKSALVVLTDVVTKLEARITALELEILRMQEAKNER